MYLKFVCITARTHTERSESPMKGKTRKCVVRVLDAMSPCYFFFFFCSKYDSRKKNTILICTIALADIWFTHIRCIYVYAEYTYCRTGVCMHACVRAYLFVVYCKRLKRTRVFLHFISILSFSSIPTFAFCVDVYRITSFNHCTPKIYTHNTNAFAFAFASLALAVRIQSHARARRGNEAEEVMMKKKMKNTHTRTHAYAYRLIYYTAAFTKLSEE